MSRTKGISRLDHRPYLPPVTAGGDQPTWNLLPAAAAAAMAAGPLSPPPPPPLPAGSDSDTGSGGPVPAEAGCDKGPPPASATSRRVVVAAGDHLWGGGTGGATVLVVDGNRAAVADSDEGLREACGRAGGDFAAGGDLAADGARGELPGGGREAMDGSLSGGSAQVKPKARRREEMDDREVEDGDGDDREEGEEARALHVVCHRGARLWGQVRCPVYSPK